MTKIDPDQMIERFKKDLLQVTSYADRKGVTAPGVWRVIKSDTDGRILKEDIQWIDGVAFLSWSQHKDVYFAEPRRKRRRGLIQII